MSGVSSEITISNDKWAAYLIASVGTAEKDTGSLASEGCSLTGLTEVGEGRNLRLYETLLAETGRGESHEGGNDNTLGEHYE